MDLLKFIICGNVDDGKSTLTGRLLLDTGNIFEDQFTDYTHKTTGDIDLARVTDGLRAEREQGITIDVAYKYFATPKRKFICIDAPGHKEYTRNMISGASQADAAVLLIDARHGITEQTMRHANICRFLGIGHVLVIINKMDAVNYSQEIFHSITMAFAEKLQLSSHTQFIPASGLTGENITKPSANLSWYKGPALLDLLESIHISKAEASEKWVAQLVVQQTDGQYIFLHGNHPGIAEQKLISARTGETLTLSHASGLHPHMVYTGDHYYSRGDVFVSLHTPVQAKQQLGVELFNVSDHDLKPGSQYLVLAQQLLQHGTLVSEAFIPGNEFGLAMLDMEKPVYLCKNDTIQGILIDAVSKKTIAAFRSLHPAI
ncbi:MAG: GTP-binding protein [Bacteroidetes bacterium]|nr:GTP-binding protein [Bacteroidota bacterium]